MKMDVYVYEPDRFYDEHKIHILTVTEYGDVQSLLLSREQAQKLATVLKDAAACELATHYEQVLP